MSSGSGTGFYRFRCKNFLTHNCTNWVWVNNTPCAECVAAGRESLEGLLNTTSSASQQSAIELLQLSWPLRFDADFQCVEPPSIGMDLDSNEAKLIKARAERAGESESF